MRYPLDEFPAIPPEAQACLKLAGITNTDQLLERSALPRQRKELAGKTGLTVQELTRWAGMADLVRVKGIGPAYAARLVLSGEVLNIQQLLEIAGKGEEAAAQLVQRLKAFHQQSGLSSRSLSKAELVNAVEEARELRPRLVLESYDNGKDFGDYLDQEDTNANRVVHKTNSIFTGVIWAVFAVLLIAFNLVILYKLHQGIAQSQGLDGIEQLLVGIFQKILITFDVLIVCIMIVVYVFLWRLPSMAYDACSWLMMKRIKPLLFSSPSYRTTYQRIHLSITVRQKVMPLFWVVGVIMGAVALIFAWREIILQHDQGTDSMLIAFSQLTNGLTALAILSSIVLAYPWLRYLFFVFKHQSDHEPEAIRRYSIYTLMNVAVLIGMIFLVVWVVLPNVMNVLAVSTENYVIPHMQTSFRETRADLQLLPEGDEQLEERRDDALITLDKLESLFITQVSPSSLMEVVEIVLNNLLPPISWVILITVLFTLLLPFLVLGGWGRGVFYIVLLSISFALENRLAQITPQWFRLEASSPAGILIIAVCIFGSALLFDWLYDTWAEPKNPCPGCGRMLDQRDVYCPACGLVQGGGRGTMDDGRWTRDEGR